MTEEELIAIVTRQLMGLATNFDADNYADAVDAAEEDTGFTMPVTSSFQINWMKRRTKANLYSFLLNEYAKKFKYEGISLEQPFKHIQSLLKDENEAFEKAMEEHAFEFAGVEAHQMFGTRIDAGFQYDPVTGEDTTFTDSNQIILSPNEYDNED